MAPYVPRERKHRKIARAAAQSSVPEAQEETTLGARDTKLNPKKRKRLEKYLETKLKKEANADIISKLSQQSAVDTSLLQSSKKLGRVAESKRERLSRALRERDAGIGNGEELLEARKEAEQTDPSDAESADGEGEPARATTTPTIAPQNGFGDGLKRPLEVDEEGKPLIRQRKRRRKNKPATKPAPVVEESEDESEGDSADGDEDEAGTGSEGEEDEWNGFSDNEAPSGDDGSGSDESEEDEDEEEEEDNKPRISAFKQWADAQRNAAADFTPSTVPTVDHTVKANFKPRAPSPDPMLAPLNAPPTSTRPVGSITIDRAESIQTARLELPVVQEEQKIMEAIHNNPIVVICGATGSGKTTQIPQMLYENGYGSRAGTLKSAASSTESLQNRGMIGITQPRRVAATSVADRVSHELGPSHRNRVAHQVRYDTNVSRETAIKFMTDGILLREIQQDFVLAKYSCVVIDEAHERSVNTDILIGLLSRIVPLRHKMSTEDPTKHYPLKLIIMSATLRVADFLKNERLFKNGAPPIVEAEGRQFPVTTHFARRTRQEFLDETVEKVAKGHRKLPPGGMLVFLTGQQEIQTVAARLKERLGGSSYVNVHASNSGREGRGEHRGGDDLDDYDEDTAPRKGGFVEDEMPDQAEADDSDAEIDVDDNEFAIPEEPSDAGSASKPKVALKPQILPLYAALPANQQSKVFEDPPEGYRQIILATNVAETSLTIPGIRYVFDCGRSKEKVYSPDSGIQTFETQWISKASASQRTGRAGRTGPGHCWRLYSSAVYEQFFAEHSAPEILRTPLESVVLQLKGFDVENVPNFPFPTPPAREQLRVAEQLLVNLGAVVPGGGGVTKLGEELARLPVAPRYGKMLLKGRELGVANYVVALVAGLAVGELFIPEPQAGHTADDEEDPRMHHGNEDEAKRQHHQAYTRAQAKLSSLDPRSDAVKVLTAIVMHADAGTKKKDKGVAFSQQFFLRQKGMEEAQQLRHQLWNILSSSTQNGGLGTYQVVLPKPTEATLGAIRQVTAAGFVDQVAIRADLLPDGGEGVAFGRKPRRAGEVAYRTLQPLPPSDLDAAQQRSLEPAEREMLHSVFVHPSSVLSRLSSAEMPGYIVYSHLSRSSANLTGAKVPRTRLHPLSAVGPKTVAFVAQNTPLIVYGKPITSGLVTVAGGGREKMVLLEREGGKVRECWVPVSVQGGEGNAEWPLDSWKVVQRKGKRGSWTTERVLVFGPSKK